MPRKVAVQSSIRLKAYSIIEEAIDNGLELGWNRAHKHTDTPAKEYVIDGMERAGIVGPPDGSKPRVVLIKKEDYFSE